MLKCIAIFLKHKGDCTIHILRNLLYSFDILSWRSFYIRTYTSASFFLTAAYYPIERTIVYPFPSRNLGCLNFFALKNYSPKKMGQCPIPHTLANAGYDQSFSFVYPVGEKMFWIFLRVGEVANLLVFYWPCMVVLLSIAFSHSLPSSLLDLISSN